MIAFILLLALVEAYKTAVSAIVSETAERLQKYCDQGEQFELAWNKCSVLLVKCAQVSYTIGWQCYCAIHR